MASEEIPIARPARGCVKVRYTGEHIVSSVQAAENARNKARLGETSLAWLKWWFPRTWRRKLASREASTRKLPHRTTLDRAEMKVDIGAMLARREWYRTHGPMYRYIAYDASPQHGQEFFVTVERVILESALDSMASWSARPAVESRLMPLATLGKGRMGLAEKTQAYIHRPKLSASG